MDTNLLIGLAALAFGAVTGVLRFIAPQRLGKLRPMQERFGQKLGGAIHFGAYTVVPVAVGVVSLLLWAQNSQ
jgi:hypothetical protein